jgi:hypothetical protein
MHSLRIQPPPTLPTEGKNANIPGVTLGQHAHLPCLLNSKSSWPITTLQILEAVDRDPRSSRGELQQSRLLLGIPGTNTLPEVLDDLIVLCVTTIVGVLLPVVDINVSDTTDKELKLALIEYVHKIWRDEFVKSGYKGVKLFVNALLDAPFGYETTRVLIF